MEKYLKKIILILIVFSLFSCNQSPNKIAYEILKSRIQKYSEEVKTSKLKYKELNFSDITDFEWEKFYVFDEHIPLKRIEEVIGFKWSKGSSVPDGKHRIMFVKDKSVISFIDYRLENLPIFFFQCGSNEQIMYNKEEAIFTVFESCNDLGKLFPLIPINCLEGFERYFERDCENNN